MRYLRSVPIVYPNAPCSSTKFFDFVNFSAIIFHICSIVLNHCGTICVLCTKNFQQSIQHTHEFSTVTGFLPIRQLNIVATGNLYTGICNAESACGSQPALEIFIRKLSDFTHTERGIIIDRRQSHTVERIVLYH